jgi:hypothetical protein
MPPGGRRESLPLTCRGRALSCDTLSIIGVRMQQGRTFMHCDRAVMRGHRVSKRVARSSLTHCSIIRAQPLERNACARRTHVPEPDALADRSGYGGAAGQ